MERTLRIERARFRSRGGVHPEYCKELAAGKPVETLPVPALLVVSMAQHFGAPAKPLVKKGDTVFRGQLIGEPGGFISAAVHAPTSGTVKDVATVLTPSGQSEIAVVIEADGQDRPEPGVQPVPNWRQLSPKELVGLVGKAGVVGLGGAGFPTHVKLSPPPNKKIDTLIVNGAECEPYLAADHRLMLEKPDKIRGGIEVVRKILGVGSVVIAVEDNKPDAIAKLGAALADLEGDVRLVVLKTTYPQGAEKQLIYSVLGREVPSGGLPMDVGALVENVATVAAMYDAVVRGMPLIERIVTVTGSRVARPANLLCRVGTPFSRLIEFCGGLTGRMARLIAGGPMMGLAQSTLETPVTKTCSGIVALGEEETVLFASLPCVGCGRCVEACPMLLMPNELSQFIEAEKFEAAEEYSVMDCIECGCCAYECPARRPIVQHMRRGKMEVGARIRARQQQQKAQAK